MAALTKPDIAYMKAHSDDNLSVSYIAACAGGIFLAYVAVAMRFISRRRAHAPIMADDWLLLVALMIVSGFIVPNILSIYYGMGRHIIFVTDIQGFVEANVASELIYAIGFVPIKLSVLYLYTRLFESMALKRTAIAIAVIITAYSVAQVIATILQCLPLAAIWTGEGACMRKDIMFTVFSSLNIATDVVLLLLPMPFLRTMQLSTSGRLQLSGLYALGACACCFSIIRAIYVYNLGPYDLSWNGVWAAIWSVIDLCFTLVCACLPTIYSTSSSGPREDGSEVESQSQYMSEEKRRSLSMDDTRSFTIDEKNAFSIPSPRRSGGDWFDLLKGHMDFPLQRRPSIPLNFSEKETQVTTQRSGDRAILVTTDVAVQAHVKEEFHAC